MKFARKQHPTVYNRVDLCVTIHKPILLGGLVLFNDKNKKYEKIRKNTKPSLRFEIRIRIFLSWTPPRPTPKWKYSSKVKLQFRNEYAVSKWNLSEASVLKWRCSFASFDIFCYYRKNIVTHIFEQSEISLLRKYSDEVRI